MTKAAPVARGQARHVAGRACAAGAAARCPPSPGKRRCFQHGGARGIGAPTGNDNARKHGFFSHAETAERHRINAFIRECLRTLEMVDAGIKGSPDWDRYRAARRLRP